MSAIPPTPSTLPPPPQTELPGRAKFVQLARASWISVIISFALIWFLLPTRGKGSDPETARITAAISAGVHGLLMLVGVSAGIAALFGVRRHGRKEILAPALTGLLIWLALMVLAIPAFLTARSVALANRPTAQTAVVRQAGARRIEVPETSASFDLPGGYVDIPAGTRLPNAAKQGFIRPMTGEPSRMLLVAVLGGTLNRQHLRAEDLPPGAGRSLGRFSWRGIEIDGVRLLEQSEAGPYVTWHVQIPLRPKALQLSFSGAAAQEAEIRKTADTVLASLDGPSTW